MSDERRFLATILDAPHDAGPREVFADWLQEQGDPWGELIHLQCELARSDDYQQAMEKTRGGFPHYGKAVERSIIRCRTLLDRHTGEYVSRCMTAYWQGRGVLLPASRCAVKEFSAVDGELVWWRELSRVEPERQARVFIWRGLPERLVVSASQWVDWHAEYMGSFPLWYLRLKPARERQEEHVGSDALAAIGQYAGRMLTTLDIPNWLVLNAFTAWVCNLLDAWGEAAMKHTGQPFTLKVGQAIMSGPPHSVQERWQRYCDGWLKNSNVRVESRLEARPAGEAMPSGVR